MRAVFWQVGPVERSEARYARIKDCLPHRRGHMSIDNRTLLNALLFVLENGCKWRAVSWHFDRWHTVYLRLARGSRAGVIGRVFARLPAEQIFAVRIKAVGLDSTSIKVHPDGTGARQRLSYRPIAYADARDGLIASSTAAATRSSDSLVA